MFRAGIQTKAQLMAVFHFDDFTIILKCGTEEDDSSRGKWAVVHQRKRRRR